MLHSQLARYLSRFWAVRAHQIHFAAPAASAYAPLPSFLYHLDRLLNAMESIFSKVKLDGVDTRKSVVTVKTLTLFGCLEIAKKSNNLGHLDSALRLPAPCHL